MLASIETRGLVAPGFEPVARELELCVQEGGEAGLAVAVHLDGRPILDAVCGTAGGEPWAEDALAVAFSCTKGAVALCAQILSDRGLLDVDAPVTRYWPEFGAAGKESTLVRHVLAHTAGVVAYPRYWDDIGKDGRGLEDWELMTSRFAASPPSWRSGDGAFYHGLSYGYLVGELIRRIDGRTVGRFFAEEVAEPLGLSFWIGTPADSLPRVVEILPQRRLDPETLPEPEKSVYLTLIALFEKARETVRAGDALSLDALLWSFLLMHPDLEHSERYLADLMNQEVMRRSEIPGGNGIGDARSLSRMYALLAMGGELDGVRLVSPESIELFSKQQSVVPNIAPFALGYHLMPPELQAFGPSARAFGHAGAGGALAFADPERRLSFALLKNQMNQAAQSVARIVRVLYSCLPS